MSEFPSFLRLNNISLYMCVCVCVCVCVWYYIYHILLIHSSVNGHLGCIHLLAIVSNAAMNIGIHISLWDPFNSSGYIPRCGIAGSYSNSFLNILKNAHSIFKEIFCNVMILYMYTLWMIITIKLINTYITSHSYHFWVCVSWEHLRSILFANFNYTIQYY